MGQLSLRQWIFGIIGVIALGLGLVGIVVPLVPTTPFLLLAAACFMRSSDRLYGWLINHKWFGGYIKSYREHRAISLRAKLVSLAVLWIAISYTSLVIITMGWLRILLVLIAVGVSLYLLRLKTLTKEMTLLEEEGINGRTKTNQHSNLSTESDSQA
jgi:uncharacterized membrane protein YbaN (DUF454 family)